MCKKYSEAYVDWSDRIMEELSRNGGICRPHEEKRRVEEAMRALGSVRSPARQPCA